MNQEELQEILTNHAKWLNNEEVGSSANLSGADLCGADLCGADLCNADLSVADLSNANLSVADLSDADLRGADLRSADLRGADLSSANLRDADLRGADLRSANLSGADLCGADLCNADLSGADIRDVKYNEYTAFFAIQCPEEGSFTCFKKICKGNESFIVKLEIPADAKRGSATSRKCRCSKAEVVAILRPDGSDSGLVEIHNSNYPGLTYKVGETAIPDGWDEDRWNECSNGIHFFMTFEEAKNY